MATIIVRQTGSPIRRKKDQRATLVGLGLNRLGRTSTTFHQAVFSEGRCVASAQSVTVLIDEQSRKPAPLTEDIIGNFQRWMLRTGVDAA